MIEKRDFLERWIVREHPASKHVSLTLVDHCVLIQYDESKAAAAFTVFEPRTLNKDFVDKVIQRSKGGTLKLQSCALIVPPSAAPTVAALEIHDVLPQLEVRQTRFIQIHFEDGNFTIRESLKVLCVDDSPVMIKLVERACTQLGFAKVIGSTCVPTETMDLLTSLRPDVIALDIQMPIRSGLDVLSDIKASSDCPVLMISSLELEEGSQVFEALSRGAFDFIPKPRNSEWLMFVETLGEKILAATQVNRIKIARRRKSLRPQRPVTGSSSAQQIWALGASTGGTQALTEILAALPPSCPPVLVVQHIPPVFSLAFAESLNEVCGITVKEARNGEPLKPGHAYIAPGGLQMGVTTDGMTIRIKLSDSEPVNRFKPSVDYLFNSLTKIHSHQIVAGVLTGMGRDGAQGLLNLKKLGAITLAQSEESSTVYGMPRAAIEMGATENSVDLDSIADFLLESGTSQKAVG